MAGRSSRRGGATRRSERLRRRLALAQRAAQAARPRDWNDILAGDLMHIVGGFACVKGAAMFGTGSRELRGSLEKVVRSMNADLPVEKRVAIMERDDGSGRRRLLRMRRIHHSLVD